MCRAICTWQGAPEWQLAGAADFGRRRTDAARLQLLRHHITSGIKLQAGRPPLPLTGSRARAWQFNTCGRR